MSTPSTISTFIGPASEPHPLPLPRCRKAPSSTASAIFPSVAPTAATTASLPPPPTRSTPSSAPTARPAWAGSSTAPQSDLYPRFIQNGGLDFTNPNHDRPSVNGLSTQSGNLDIDLIKEARANFNTSCPSPASAPSSKPVPPSATTPSSLNAATAAGATSGRTAPNASIPILQWNTVKTGRKIPIVEAAEIIAGQPTNPALWLEDRYFYEQNKLSASNKTNEVITSYYLMTQGRIGSNGFLGGLR